MVSAEELEISRYEVKFVIQQSFHYRMRQWVKIHPQGLYEPYPQRTVNNIYFDNQDCDSYTENLTGCSSRTKLRLRWYGDTVNPNLAMLELKSKRNKLGFKSSHVINFSGRQLSAMTYRQIISDIAAQIDGDILLRFQLSQVPVLINRYNREYFVTRDGKVRVTLDSDLEFFDQRNRFKPNIVFNSLAPSICILEVKTPSRDIDRARSVLETIEAPPSRSSKYVLGVQSLLGFQ